jgi:hypothetical protein
VSDFYSTPDNEAAQLILTNESGSITGWLDKSTVAAGGYESMKGAAVNWKAIGDKYYYQTKINASDFTGIKVQAQMLYNYIAHKTQVIEYSIDGKTWKEVSVVPYPSTIGHAYGSMTISPKGELIVYAYNSNDQVNMSYAVSPDMGNTWTNLGKSFVKKQIRNPQVGRLDEYYILTGRAGQNETIASDFVIYTSLDGINWDDGLALGNGIRRSCWYSSMLPIKMPNGKTRLYVKYSENYNEFPKEMGCQVNNMLAYFEKIDE